MWVIQTKFETPVLNFNQISASGDHQVISIDFANFHAIEEIDTDGAKVPHPYLSGQEITDPSGSYQDNRITIYNGTTPYNLWFSRPTPIQYFTNPFTQQVYPAGPWYDLDPSTQDGSPNTVKVDVSITWIDWYAEGSRKPLMKAQAS